jgi:ABC-type multidrug transport system ATPase subunit
MMEIELKNLGKRFNRQWIFRNLHFSFQQGRSYAITGKNGSGKSTLLQIIAGALEKNEGEIFFKENGNLVNPEIQYRYFSFSAPYLELIEELTLTEFFEFHFSLKPILEGFSIAQVIEKMELKNAANKQIRQFSSGMKQRAKLGQAFFSRVPVLLLDEPTANLDVQGIELYLKLVEEVAKDRLIIICSNDENEISFCRERINMADHKNF